MRVSSCSLEAIGAFGAKPYNEDEKRELSEIVQAFNDRHGTDFTDADMIRFEQVNKEIMDEDYDSLIIQENSVIYNNIEAKRIVFAEGFGLKQNPFFNDLPLKGTKGELLTIHAPALNIDFVLKSGVFLIPLGDQNFIVGATYEWTDKTNNPTEQGKEELVRKLDKILSCDYEIIDHMAGMRPTVVDRRPLVGQHPEHKALYVLNGLGTRGVMIAPYAAKNLFEHIEQQKVLDREMSIERFV